MPSVSVPAIEIFLEPDEVGLKFARLFEDRDTTGLHQDIGEHLINSTDERFITERAPDGAPWAPLEAQRERIFAGMLSRMNPSLRARVESLTQGA